MHTAIHVYTFKEGLLSKLAHDLLLRMDRIELVREGQEVRVTCDTSAWTVVSALHDGTPIHPGPSESDRRKIVQNIRDSVLRTHAFPSAQYLGQATERDDGVAMQGSLTLCGVTLPLNFTLLRQNDALRASFEIVPSRWGIKPYRALGGTLRVQDRVRIEILATAPTS